MSRVSHGAAQASLDAAERTARELGARLVMALVDDAGTLQAYRRMDGSPLASIALATDKAYTAAALGQETEALGQRIASDPPLDHGFRGLPRALTFLGGHPIHVGGSLAGGIAVGGSRPANDAAAVNAAIAAIQSGEAK